MPYTSQDIAFLATQGLGFPSGINPLEVTPALKANVALAFDAQPQLITTPNAGIPALFTNLVDPEVVRVITQPLKAAEIIGETKKGDWTTLSTQFPVVESAGQVSSYGDFNNNGTTSANVNWVPRQSYHYQTVTQYGERELEMYGAAKISYKSELDTSAALVMAQYMNKTFFFGVAGLENFGLLNDPGLIAPITPTVKVGGGTSWDDATGEEEFQDISKLYNQLVVQMGGNIDRSMPMILAMSPEKEAQLLKTNQYGINVLDLIKKAFPALRIETAPQYATVAGEVMQLILDNYQGLQTAYAAFTEKLRAHAVIPALSSFSQKKSAGTWGSVIRRPICIAGMIGI